MFQSIIYKENEENSIQLGPKAAKKKGVLNIIIDFTTSKAWKVLQTLSVMVYKASANA